MRYIFPRQFGLHNVFTSMVDSRETAMPFKDYTLRENDIHKSMCIALGAKVTDRAEVDRWKTRAPKRLRGHVFALVQKLRILNQRCSYVELLRHYCPVEVLRFFVYCVTLHLINSNRVYLCPQGRGGGTTHFSQTKTYVRLSQPSATRVAGLAHETNLQFNRRLAQTCHVPQRMFRHFVAPSFPESSRKDAGVTIITGASSCIGSTNSST